MKQIVSLDNIPTSSYAQAQEEPAEAGRSRRTLTALVVLSAAFMSVLDVFIVNVAFPAIGRRFAEANVARLSWVLNAYAIVFAALLVPAGRWADRAGRKRSFLAGVVLFTAASVLCAGATSVGMLIGARILQAAGAALLWPAAIGLLLATFPPEKRSIAIALFAAAGAVAAASGAPAGGLLSELGWRSIFLVNLPVGLVALIAGARVLREIRESGSKERPDLLGALILAAGIGCLVLVIIKGRDWSWNVGRMLTFSAAAIGLMAWFFGRSRTHPAPVIELPMLRVRSFALSNLSAMLFAIAFGAMLLSNVMFLTHVWGSASWLLGLQLAPGPLMAAAVALPAGKLCARIGQRTVAVAGALSFAFGSAWWIWQLGPVPHYLSQFLAGSLFVGIGVGLSLPSVSSAAIAALPPERLSTGSAILNMSRQIGTALGVAILVAIVGDAHGPTSMVEFRYGYFAMGFAALGSGLTCLALKRGDLLAKSPID